jgi:hypothetical protein
MMPESTQLLAVHGTITTLKVEAKDPAIDLSQLKITIEPSSDEDIKRAYKADPENTMALLKAVTDNSEPYRRCRVGFGAIQE